MRRLVIGDIHSRHGALLEVFEKSGFDYDDDMLIILGDIVDGGSDAKTVVDELLRIKNKVFILGNHDEFFMRYINYNAKPVPWLTQGGTQTLESYGGDGAESVVPERHKRFFDNALYYFELDGKLFVHGGFDPEKPIRHQDAHELLWDRSIIRKAESKDIAGYSKVFIGHTTTQAVKRDSVNFKCRDCGVEWGRKFVNDKDLRNIDNCDNCGSENIHQSFGCVNPVMIGNLVCLDTGAGWDGRLTIMDIDSLEFWQSSLQEPPIK